IISVLTIALLVISIYSVYSYDLPKQFLFDKEGSLKEWQEKVFKNKVIYVVEAEGKGGYLSAKSEAACSGLFYRIRFDTRKLPMISWHWKVTEFPEKAKSDPATLDAKEGWIEKDDYAARVYVIFPRLNFTRTESIEYIWDENLPEETIMTSPYFENIKLIVVESGKNGKGKWIFEERNIYEDYKKAFGRAPATRVGAIAVMTDTDNTLSTAEALYKDMKVGYKNE
ncbi:MAG: DUF3047 domain-containing protein, partial [Candidatus Omnitrophota bacterium]|nr:DUF3047 domain-containing protein [Candidatus Omnitrophota bacterium]